MRCCIIDAASCMLSDAVAWDLEAGGLLLLCSHMECYHPTHEDQGEGTVCCVCTGVRVHVQVASVWRVLLKGE